MNAIDDEAGNITAQVQLRLLPSHPKLRNEPSLMVDVHSAQFTVLHATVERFMRSAPLQSRAFAETALSILQQIEVPAPMQPCVFRAEGAHLVVDHHMHPTSSPNAAADPLHVFLHAYHLRFGMERMNSAIVTQLPTAQLEAAWHCLHLREGVKRHSLSYMLMRRKPNNSATCRGLLLLHGHPGRGKNTATRALAQQGWVNTSADEVHQALSQAVGANYNYHRYHGMVEDGYAYNGSYSLDQMHNSSSKSSKTNQSNQSITEKKNFPLFVYTDIKHSEKEFYRADSILKTTVCRKNHSM